MLSSTARQVTELPPDLAQANEKIRATAKSYGLDFFDVIFEMLEYDQINQRVNPPDNPPEGMIFHSAGPLPGGGWRIVDVWESRAAFDRFFGERVQPTVAELVGQEAMAQGQPPEVTSWPVHNHNSGGG